MVRTLHDDAASSVEDVDDVDEVVDEVDVDEVDDVVDELDVLPGVLVVGPEVSVVVVVFD